MMSLCCDVIQTLQGKTLVTAESLTGGGLGAALTAVSGASAVYKGGIISYTNEVKHKLLGVPMELLDQFGAVSVTGLAGPTGDAFGNPVGTVFIGYSDSSKTAVKYCLFSGDRESIRNQTIEAALNLVLTMQK